MDPTPVCSLEEPGPVGVSTSSVSHVRSTPLVSCSVTKSEVLPVKSASVGAAVTRSH